MKSWSLVLLSRLLKPSSLLSPKLFFLYRILWGTRNAKPDRLGCTRVDTPGKPGVTPGCSGHARVGTLEVPGCETRLFGSDSGMYSGVPRAKPDCSDDTRVGALGCTRVPDLVVWVVVGQVLWGTPVLNPAVWIVLGYSRCSGGYPGAKPGCLGNTRVQQVLWRGVPVRRVCRTRLFGSYSVPWYGLE